MEYQYFQIQIIDHFWAGEGLSKMVPWCSCSDCVLIMQGLSSNPERVIIEIIIGDEGNGTPPNKIRISRKNLKPCLCIFHARN